MGTTLPRTERRTRSCVESRLGRLRISAAIFAAFVVPNALATPPAGTAVTNQATAIFLDAAHTSRTTDSNTDALTVGNPTANETAPVLSLSLAVSSTSVAPMASLTYTLIAVNTGTTNASGTAVVTDGVFTTAVVIRDPLPPHTTFAAFNSSLPARVQALYHIAGTPDQTYVTKPPASLTTIDAVAFATPTLAAGAQISGSFTIYVNGNASLNGNTQLTNSSTVFAAGTETAGTQATGSNPVSSTLTAVPETIQDYSGADYKTVASSVNIGSPLYLAATAAACNADPTVKETHVVVITDSSGDRETFNATESGPNTGLFQLASVPTEYLPVAVGNGIVEAANGESVTVEMPDCGTRVVTTLTFIDPAGVVFDSKTNTPVANAVVTLLNATGNACTTTPATVTQMVNGAIQPSISTVTTTSTGEYHFPLVAPGSYCVSITPPVGYAFPSAVAVNELPPGRRILSIGPTAGGSYGGVFTVATAVGPVTMDVPLDARAITGLFVQKTASKTRAEVGDFVDYTIVVADNTGSPLPAGGALTDRLPAGFIYQSGTARLNGAPLADPQIGKGAVLTFTLPALTAGTPTNVSYRVELGPNSLAGDGINRAQATVLTAVSNVATASVQIDGGVFSNDAFIIGKVYLDCNSNQINDEEESGIPGVRLYLEDGTYVITDEEGKYSLYGITPKTHVLKLDKTSLPPGATLEILSNRNAGDPGSVFVDLRNGELHKANFATNACAPSVLDEVTTRYRKLTGSASAPDHLVLGKLDADSSLKPLSDVRALPASGVLSPNGNLASDANLTALAAGRGGEGGFNAVAANFSQLAPAVSGLPPAPVRVAPVPALETLLPALDNSPGFIGLTDQSVLAVAQTHIRVKGAQGSAFILRVNGKEISPARVGKKSVLASRSLQAWEYFGVDLTPGVNHLQVTQIDQFGNVRGEQAIDVTAPDRMGQLA